MNAVKLSGKVGDYIYFSHLESGTATIEFTLIVESNWRTDKKTKKKKCSFIHCQAYANTAIGLQKVVQKGRKLTITKAELMTTWKTDKNDEKVYRTTVQVQEFLFKG